MKLLRDIQELLDVNWAPTFFTTDFEVGFINAIHKVLPHTRFVLFRFYASSFEEYGQNENVIYFAGVAFGENAYYAYIESWKFFNRNGLY